jgi:hypothetical protein
VQISGQAQTHVEIHVVRRWGCAVSSQVETEAFQRGDQAVQALFIAMARQLKVGFVFRYLFTLRPVVINVRRQVLTGPRYSQNGCDVGWWRLCDAPKPKNRSSRHKCRKPELEDLQASQPAQHPVV